MENDMMKTVTTATFLIVIAMPAFAQSADPDLGTGNIAPLAATNQGGASAYAKAPNAYETEYSPAQASRRIPRAAPRSGHNPKAIQNENGDD
jgi:hypothetical protein